MKKLDMAFVNYNSIITSNEPDNLIIQLDRQNAITFNYLVTSYYNHKKLFMKGTLILGHHKISLIDNKLGNINLFDRYIEDRFAHIRHSFLGIFSSNKFRESHFNREIRQAFQTKKQHELLRKKRIYVEQRNNLNHKINHINDRLSSHQKAIIFNDPPF